ncbi:MAG TPA: hypothetical protein VNL35_12560 [Chloroflexota bacterium]|nr:hypothetical protein [Chloroflexota bacterium]
MSQKIRHSLAAVAVTLGVVSCLHGVGVSRGADGVHATHGAMVASGNTSGGPLVAFVNTSGGPLMASGNTSGGPLLS